MVVGDAMGRANVQSSEKAGACSVCVCRYKDSKKTEAYSDYKEVDGNIHHIRTPFQSDKYQHWTGTNIDTEKYSESIN